MCMCVCVLVCMFVSVFLRGYVLLCVFVFFCIERACMNVRMFVCVCFHVDDDRVRVYMHISVFVYL